MEVQTVNSLPIKTKPSSESKANQIYNFAVN